MNSRNILMIAVLCLYHSGMFAQTAADNVQPGKDLSPRYVLVDGALWGEQYMDIMKEECSTYRPLFRGSQLIELKSVTPYLVDISESGAEHISRRVKQDPVKLRVTRLHSKMNVDSLRTHLRRFMRVTTDTGKRVFFRFWDPYALNGVFPNLSQYPFISEEFVADFFAPVEYLITEDAQTNERRIYYLSTDKKLQIKIEAIENADDKITARPAFPQKVKGAGGRWAIVNITPEQARERAIEEAKKEALRKAGIPENIKVAGALSTVEEAGQNRQLFSEFSNIEMHGAVTDYIIVKDVQEKEPADGLFYAVVEIDATVKKYRSVADPEFKIDVRGLRNNGYKNGEAITFSVHPNREGYLKIFLFENMDVAAQVFPNDYEENRRLEAKRTLHFPLVESISYTAEKSASGRQEHNLLLFVYTKSDVPFYGAVTSKRVLGWINGMEPDEREVVVAPLMISD